MVFFSSSHRARFRRHRRRGFSTAIMLVSAFVLLGLMALALDMAMVTLTAQQIQAGVDSAALAGAAENFDRSLLCPDYADLDLPVGDLERHPDADQIAAFESETMRSRALEFAALNQAQGQTLSLQDNLDNDASGDIVLLNIDDPTAASPQVAQWPLAGHADGVQVTIPRTTARGNSVELWIAKSLGLTSVDISPSARAAFDQRVYGFQPLGHITVPILPILTELNGWPAPEGMDTCIEVAPDNSNDRFAVAPATGEVVEVPLGEPGDGFPEITFIIRQSQTEGNAHLIPFNGEVTDVATFDAQVNTQIVVGLYESDLTDEELGGAVALGADNEPLQLSRIAPAPTASSLAVLAATLMDAQVKGQKRIWPLGTVTDAPANTTITDFAAGRVVDVSIDAGDAMDQTDDSLLITVQPCLLQTSTALVRAGKAPNKWLGKVMLIR